MDARLESPTRRKAVFGGAATALAVAMRARAQSYPTKPIRIVVPFPAGGVTDIVGRLVAEKLSASLNQSVVVENRAGASGMIGAEAVARAAADGYTLLVSSTAEVAINQNLYKKMSYSPEKDLAPVTLAATTPLVLVAHPGLNARTIGQLAEVARKRQSPVTYASAGAGGVQHMAGALLESKLKLGLTHVPYRGAPPALVDLIGGRVDVMFQSAPLVIDHVRGGKLTALAVTSKARIASLPEVPTVNEALHITGFEISNWYGVFVPAGTPEGVAARLNAEIAAALRSADVRERLTAAGADPVGNGRDEFLAFWRAETEKFAQIIRISGATVD